MTAWLFIVGGLGASGIIIYFVWLIQDRKKIQNENELLRKVTKDKEQTIQNMLAIKRKYSYLRNRMRREASGNKGNEA